MKKIKKAVKNTNYPITYLIPVYNLEKDVIFDFEDQVYNPLPYQCGKVLLRVLLVKAELDNEIQSVSQSLKQGADMMRGNCRNFKEMQRFRLLSDLQKYIVNPDNQFRTKDIYQFRMINDQLMEKYRDIKFNCSKCMGLRQR